MIKGDEWFMIRQLHREYLTISEIARKTGRDRKTVRKVVNAAEQPVFKTRPTPPSKLDPYKVYIKSRVDAGMTNAVKMHWELGAMGYDGGVTVVRRFMPPLRQNANRGAIMRYETAPGEQAQVDWASCGRGLCQGILRTVYCFVMTLAYSRMMYIEFTWRADTRAFIRGHINAFAYFRQYKKLRLRQLKERQPGIRRRRPQAESGLRRLRRHLRLQTKALPR